ncbi:MAG: hypothetical protein ABI758_01640 [Candidatus Woesebacteria bacterium]
MGSLEQEVLVYGDQNPNRRFDTLKIPQIDPGVIDPKNAVVYIADMINAFCHQDGGLFVFDPEDMSKLHPGMEDAIRHCVLLLNLVARANESTKTTRLVQTILPRDAHHPGNPSWASSYRNASSMQFQTITRADLDNWDEDQIATQRFDLSDFKRLLDLAQTMKTYTMEHGNAFTMDSAIINELRYHPAKKDMPAKGDTISPGAGMVSEQWALSQLTTGESTGYTEDQIADGRTKKFIAGMCENICDAEEAKISAIRGQKTVLLVDAALPLAVPAGIHDTTESELEALGIDKRYWLGVNPTCVEPLSLEQLQNARLLSLGVQFSTVAWLAKNMQYPTSLK